MEGKETDLFSHILGIHLEIKNIDFPFSPLLFHLYFSLSPSVLNLSLFFFVVLIEGMWMLSIGIFKLRVTYLPHANKTGFSCFMLVQYENLKRLENA